MGCRHHHRCPLPAVYGTETVWSAFTLPADARLRLVTDAANGAAISYDLEISDVPQPAYAWSGVSLEDGLNANILVDLDLSGTYQLAVVLDEGFTNFAIDAYPPARIASGSSYTLTFSRPAGLYSFASIQSAGYPVTSWAASLSLLSAEAPEVLAISPDWGTVGTDTAVTIDGSNFMAGIAVELVNGGVTYDLTDVLVVSATQLLANVPDVAQEGTYDLRVTNPDDQTAVLPGAFTVFGAVPVVDSITPDTVKANVLRPSPLAAAVSSTARRCRW
ncbi:IPT/TIG domain-containing protein [Candidatus Amarobacter glycogenicus]|uniref:IPT/TIG domain-containing protein n=1 Tax=Candidatus Amarobacter glycogenicus TaxID=3140699 RepID=UPI002A12B54F|nr:IPT/TIG domain-containing protein [Dehalococcoidia bacterium]